jgi:hypothetical protein
MSAAVVLSTETAGTRDGLAQAAAVAVSAAGGQHAALLVALEDEPRRRPGTLLAAPEARRLEVRLRGGGFETASARGHLCQVSLPAGPEALDSLAPIRDLAGEGLVVFHLPARLWPAALELGCAGLRAGLLRARLPRDRSLAALVVGELRSRGLRARVATRPLGRVAARRALAGLDPGGAASQRVRRMARGLTGEQGQALPAMLGASGALLVATLALVAIGGAITGKGRAQRGADLAAISAARSMRDDVARLSAPVRLGDGSVNPRHLSRSAYFARAAAAARSAATANDIAPRRLQITFPDAAQPVPIRARVRVTGEVSELPPRPDGSPATPIPVVARATAEASPPAGGSWTGMPATASGGGYSGPLAYRLGKPMRPDVAVAFDRIASAAGKAGLSLSVTSGFRSDAEQAALFAAHPDPMWVAPPGHSLHRCATELDLGPSGAYSWLAAHASSFGFVQRYGWEPWHFGFTNSPPPCSEAGNSIGAAGGATGDGRDAEDGVPPFVPAAYREPLRRSAARWSISAAVLGAQLMAESGFNPHAVSPAGAQGIAQFMPGTGASYGLRNPFDPVAAIDAQAHLMSDLLRQLGSIPLALAAYNAGPGAVSGCHCIPPYPETKAYVARILALLGGSGAMAAPQLEVRLVS